MADKKVWRIKWWWINKNSLYIIHAFIITSFFVMPRDICTYNIEAILNYNYSENTKATNHVNSSVQCVSVDVIQCILYYFIYMQHILYICSI